MATIKLSKTQWEDAGKKAGWIKEAQTEVTQKKECHRCHGKGSVETKLKNLGTLEYDSHTIVCPMCKGKGYTNKDDANSYLHSMGVGKCPHEKEINKI